ncbi:MAG TPA: uroporphyrinogen decarboxylase family protein [Spirochaetia bacterium]|nr:uroporphyrinogen decarboxylase family protein [Spirochaetia bacterium]
MAEVTESIRLLTHAQKKQLIKETWQRRNNGYVPFFVESGTSLKATRSLITDHSRDLSVQETQLAIADQVHDYGLPSLKVNVGIGVMAAAFGCGQILDDHADPWIRPIIDDDRLDMLAKIQSPMSSGSGIESIVSAKIDHFNQNSRRQIRFVNIPSPLLTASLMWDYTSFLSALLLSPSDVHLLLEKITTATIEFLMHVKSQIRDLFAYTHESVYIPPECALRVSDDVAAILSAEQYREFGVRYNDRIAEVFGGIVVHSCGDVRNALPAMLETRNLLGIDIVAPQNDWELIRGLAGGRTALCMRYFDWDFPDAAPPDLSDYSRRLVDYFGPEGLLLWTHTPTQSEARELSERLASELTGSGSNWIPSV